MDSINYGTKCVPKGIMGNLLHHLNKADSEVFQQFQLHAEELQAMVWRRQVLVAVCGKKRPLQSDRNDLTRKVVLCQSTYHVEIVLCTKD